MLQLCNSKAQAAAVYDKENFNIITKQYYLKLLTGYISRQVLYSIAISLPELSQNSPLRIRFQSKNEEKERTRTNENNE